MAAVGNCTIYIVLEPNNIIDLGRLFSLPRVSMANPPPSTHNMKTMDKPRRRRWKNPKLQRNIHSRTSSTIRQDAELEQEVDSFLYSGVTHPRKRQRRHNTDSSKNTCANRDGDVVDDNRSLPVLLHFREIGFSRFYKVGRRESSAKTSWKSRLLHQPILSASTRPEPSLHSLSASQSQWNSLQFSTPTYYGKYSNINACIDGTKTTSCSIGEIHLQRHTWRPYTQHKIPFSKIGTPISDA